MSRRSLYRRSIPKTEVQQQRRSRSLFEMLEDRRLFSVGFTPVQNYGPLGANYGVISASKGSLAAISDAAGSVRLIDTGTNTVTPIEGSAAGGFGLSLAFLDDGRLAVGAPNEGAGHVYIYDQAGSLVGDFGGESVSGVTGGLGTALAGYNGHLLVTGAIDNAGHNAVYEVLPGGSVLNTFNNAHENFGIRLAASGNTFLASTANTLDPLVYQYTNGNLVHTYADPTGNYQYFFGDVLAISGDDIVIGAPGATDTVIFDGNGSPTAELNVGAPAFHYRASDQASLGTFEIPAQYVYSDGFLTYSRAAFGQGIAFVGSDTVVIGAPQTIDFNTFEGMGSAFAFDLATHQVVDSVDNPAHTGIDGFGAPIRALDNGNVLISDPNSGTAYVYNVVDVPAPVVLPTADAGADITDAIAGASVQFNGSAVPGTSAIAHYQWDFNYDGSFDADQDAATDVPNPTHVYTASGVYTVALQVVDESGATSIISTINVTVDTAAPTADAGADQSALTGQSVSVTGAGTAAVGATIASYEWDFDYDGATFDVDASGPAASHVYSAAGAHTVALRVTDDHGKTAVDLLTITVTTPAPVPPTASAGPDQTAVVSQAVSFTGTGTPASGATIVSYEWDFDYDGVNFTADASGANASHVYSAAGAHTAALRVTDSNGLTAIDTAVVTVASTAVVGGDLVMAPASPTGAGTFVITRNADGSLTVSNGGQNAGTFSPTGTIVIYGSQNGNFVSIPANVTNPVVFNGGTGVDVVQAGAGNDTLIGGGGLDVFNGGAGDDLIYGNTGTDIILGGAGNDVIVGGGGSDVLAGGDGRDLIIGGGGSDVLTGSASDDIVIAGSTAFDNDSVALKAISAEWASTRSYAQRLANLQGTGTGARLNGSFFLKADVSVFDDAALDILIGSSGQDWFLFNNDGAIRDIITDRAGNETITDLDLLPPA